MWSGLQHTDTEVKEFKCGACGWKTANLQILHSHLLGHKEGLNYMHHHVDAKSFPVSNMVCSATQTETIHLVDNASQTDESSFETSTLKLPGHDESSFETSTLKLPGHDAVSCQTVKVEFDSSGLYDDGETFFSNYEVEDSLEETEVKTEVFTKRLVNDESNIDAPDESARHTKSLFDSSAADTITPATPSKEAEYEPQNELDTATIRGAKGRFVSAKPARKRKNIFVKKEKIADVRRDNDDVSVIKETIADVVEDNDDATLVSWLDAKSSRKKNVSGKKETIADVFKDGDYDGAGVLEDSDNASLESRLEAGLLGSDTELEEDEVTKRRRKKIAKPKHVKSTANQVNVPKTVTYEPPKQMLQCHLCHFQSSARKFMWHHIESQHAGQYYWKCGCCRVPFVAEGDYLHHVKQCKDSWVKCHTCSECNHQKVFLSKKLLLEHLKQSHYNVFPLSCSVCNVPIASEFDEREHMSEHNQEILKCRFCETVSKSIVESEIHMVSHVRDNPYTCYICDKEFTRLQDFKEHVYSHLDDDDGSYVCETCGKLFTHHRRRVKHSRKCSGRFECKTCGKHFKDGGRLRCHQSIIHDKVKAYICDQCGKAHAYKQSLLIHIARVHSPNVATTCTYSCPVCNKVFYCRGGFERHMLLHENILPHACEYCDKKFRSKWNLTAHTRQHTGGKPYACTKCGLAFTHNVSRKNHEAKCNNA